MQLVGGEEGGSEGTRRRPGTDVLEAALAVAASLDLNGQLGEMLRRSVAWTGASLGFALGPDEDRRSLVPIASTLAPEDPRNLTGVKLDLERLSRRLEGESAASEPADPLGALERALPDACSTLLLPVRSSGRQIAGLLVLVGEPLSQEGRDRAGELIDLARATVSNALQVRSIRDLVIKDDTAECFNRRYFEEFLAEELSRASRFRAPVSLIFFDMDNLKQVNSRFGHAMGSQTLYEVSLRVRGKTRRFDKLFRFGGDEFCIVLPETEWHGALEVAERVREAIASRLFLTAELGEGGGIRMTASFGIASFPLHARTKGDLVERADRAMQKIKNGVKNSIAISEILGDESGA